MTVLLAQAIDLPVGMLENAAVAVEPEQIRRQGLRSGVDDAAVRRRVRHDPRLDPAARNRPRSPIALDLHEGAVAVDVGSGPVLGRDGHFMGAVEIGRSAVADGLDRKPGALAEIDGLGQPGVGLRHGVLGRIGHEPLELEPRRAIDRLREREGVCGRGHAATLRARIAFDQHRQLKPGARHGGRQALDRFLRIRHDLDVGPAGERHKAVELGLADQVVGQEDVGDAGVDHDLGFAELLAIDALRAELDLQMGEFGDLVGLDMRAKAQAVTVEIGLAAPEIVLHHVEVDHRARRVQVLDKQRRHSFDGAARLQRDWSRPDSGSMARIRQPRITLRQPAEALTTVISAVIVTSRTAPAMVPR